MYVSVSLLIFEFFILFSTAYYIQEGDLKYHWLAILISGILSLMVVFGLMYCNYRTYEVLKVGEALYLDTLLLSV